MVEFATVLLPLILFMLSPALIPAVFHGTRAMMDRRQRAKATAVVHTAATPVKLVQPHAVPAHA
ncbi:hypothetical protein FOS14_16145 [Skermania sp. ID1734]|uniref:hypothetical protein n=1 Tax=Skermania sp. ID1734 TaxID=2597516 RepID=UPI00117C9CF3|nr:hypothetical protein [Skermania sp. ID1734]TSD96587.1 hypothetical protein FOS14_16145 [Skermania sp. ID1734]